ncbi:FAD:protein FMN transferase [Tersicoccus solisilvae]|uniref:FAD:protein FMN transferase n=1 Tax=Tersicoccus solisilvae TaxID=1882339 RepID=A0ABQ1NWR2_9MICC|nr:FAD:protein FMN transferase [Tersicoccus solisilvae]GGC86621.1 FAD:protein FMN transferase [Tersicoccus solisilvae]
MDAARTNPADDAGADAPHLGAARWEALGTTCAVHTTDPAAVVEARHLVTAQLTELDVACSRFRDDSELTRLPHGRWVEVSPVLFAVIEAARTTAQRTGGLVDPTIATAMDAAGYDRDLAAVRGRLPEHHDPAPAPGWFRVMTDPATGQVLLPHRVDLDLGASAKAWAADRAATTAAARLSCGVLVNLGGDLRAAGPAPDDGWQLTVDDGRRDPRPAVTIRSGGLASSSTTRRTWWTRSSDGGLRRRHHILDPRTGGPTPGTWCLVSATAPTCEAANAATTAAVVLGRDAPAWLEERSIPARLAGRGTDGERRIVTTAGWPVDDTVAAAS